MAFPYAGVFAGARAAGILHRGAGELSLSARTGMTTVWRLARKQSDYFLQADFAGLIPPGKPEKPCSCLHSLAGSGAQIPHADDFVIPSVCPYVRCAG